MLEEDWPTTLEEWDEDERYLTTLRTKLYGGKCDPFLDDFTPEPCTAIRLVRNCQITSILPVAAFYHLSRLSRYISKRQGWGYSGLEDDQANELRMRLIGGERTWHWSYFRSTIYDDLCIAVRLSKSTFTEYACISSQKP